MTRTPNATYIFLSATRHRYRKNILNTLYLPSGLACQYRFKVRRNVDPDIGNAIRERSAHHTYIIFIDRMADDAYQYAIIREGRILKQEISDDRCHFHVEVREYAFGKSPELNDWLIENLTGLPKLTGSHDNENDGLYVLTGDDLPARLIEERGESGWALACDYIASTRKFRESIDFPVFLRASVSPAANNGQDGKGDRSLVLIAGDQATYTISSRLPSYGERYRDMQAVVEATSSSGLSLRGSGLIDLSGPADSQAYQLYCDILGRLPGAEISLRQTSASIDGNNVTLVLPDQPISFDLRFGFRNWLSVIALVVLYGLGQFFAAFGGIDVGGPIKLSHEMLDDAGKGFGIALSSGAMMGLMWKLFRRVK